MLFAQGGDWCGIALTGAFTLIGILVTAVTKIAIDVASLKREQPPRLLKDEDDRNERRLWDGEP